MTAVDENDVSASTEIRLVSDTKAPMPLFAFMLFVQPACSTIKARTEDGSGETIPDGIKSEYKQSDAVYMDGAIIPDPPTASGVGSAIAGAWHSLW